MFSKPLYTLSIFLLFLGLSAQVISAQEQPVPLIELTVLVSPSDHSLKGHAVIQVPEGFSAQIQTGDITIEAIRALESTEDINDPQSLNSYLSATDTKRAFELSYSAHYTYPEQEKTAPEELTNRIDPEWTFLVSGWHPSLSIPSLYTLSVEVPKGYEVISEAESIHREEKDDMREFDFAYLNPRSSVSLVVGKYRVHEEVYNDTFISIYSLEESTQSLAQYSSTVKRFLTLYTTMLGDFPVERFSLVESSSLTDISFPTYALFYPDKLISDMDLDIIIARAVLTQWFGNRILVDQSSGDWSEGLVTYLADHWIAHLSGSGKDYRKRILVLYESLVNSDNEISLNEYTGQRSPAAKAVGAGKGAMVFHMIRKKIGDESFFKGLNQLIQERDLTTTTWDDVCNAFSSSSGVYLHDFCDYWIRERGTPSVKITDLYPLYRNGNNVLELHLDGSGIEQPIDVPVRVASRNEAKDFSVQVTGSPVFQEIVLGGVPSSFVADPEYDLMRTLDPSEIPPLFITFSADTSNIAVMPEEKSPLLSQTESILIERGFTLKPEKDITSIDLRKHSFLIFTPDSRIYKQLFAGRPVPVKGTVFQVLRNPLNTNEVVIVGDAEDTEELGRALSLKQYGYASRLIKGPGRERAIQIANTPNGIVKDLSVAVSGIETKKSLSLNDIVAKIKDNTFICVGEIHTEYSHHIMQFEIIKRLHKAGRKIVIGMEMFQRPYQEFIDSYINGKLSEKEFLEKTEYFKRWSFNYNLYRDILDYARENHIPVKALNLRKEIIDKVSLSGIDSLSDKEFTEVPQLLDMTNRDYRRFMMDIFRQHANSLKRDFDNFYQSQILWDETMALSVTEADRERPDATVVIIAGNGHLQNSWGIPDRIERITGIRPIVILNGPSESIDETVADYILFPGSADAPEPPLLKVLLKKDTDRVAIEKVFPGGPAALAGMRTDDIIRVIDNRPVNDIQDIKLALFDKRPGDTIKVSFERNRFLFGTKQIEAVLTLQ